MPSEPEPEEEGSNFAEDYYNPLLADVQELTLTKEEMLAMALNECYNFGGLGRLLIFG